MNNKFITLYADFLRRSIQIERPLKVVFDCSNGTTGLILKKLLKPKTQNLKPIFINSKPDGNFPAHGPDPLAKGASNQLKKETLKRGADLGVIFDADGDRVFFIDNRGRFVDPDVIARLLIWQLKPKKIVIDVRSGWLVKKYQTSGIKYQVSRVGHYFIKKLMREIGTDFGIERSGHYYFKINNLSISNQQSAIFYYDSGIMAAVEALNAVSKLPYALADFVDLLPRYYRSGEINIGHPVSGIKRQEFLKKIENKLKTQNYKLKTINRVDGLTVEAENFWFNVRPSNTEPLIRLNIEANDPKILKKELTKLLKRIILEMK